MNLLLIIGPIVLTLLIVGGTFLALKGQLGALGGLFGAMGALGSEQQTQQRILQTGVPARARVLHVQHTGQPGSGCKSAFESYQRTAKARGESFE